MLRKLLVQEKKKTKQQSFFALHLFLPVFSMLFSEPVNSGVILEKVGYGK